MAGSDVLRALAGDAMTLCGGRPRAILGIAGTPGAGKSTLATLLCQRVADVWGADTVCHLPMDGFHLADAQLRRLGLLERKGAPETFDPYGYAHLLDRVRHDLEVDIYAPGFDRALEQPLAGAIAVAPATRLVVTEGNYLLHADLPWRRARALMDGVWFVTAEHQTRLDRLIARHIEFGKTPQQARAWVAKVDEGNAEQVAATATAADRVVINGVHGWALAA
ncbi:nucleoside/nucleotide kinase family protein [Mycobacterium sp. SMC-4]|uniref:nucleoside/nucleotide kinase family protein n=1 Tax=Mycobacterium sp. SMC-4 TaxID=2857059 RepID=UPI0028C45635|nr:nucleoside/nucleotide kinase family protein [Mycobacterium sp. SMC-4]